MERTLLGQKDIAAVFALLGIDTDSHILRHTLDSMFEMVDKFFADPEELKDTCGINRVNGWYRFFRGKSRVMINFSTSGDEHDVSKILVSCIFMEYGLIPICSRLTVTKDTPDTLRNAARDFLAAKRQNEGDLWDNPRKDDNDDDGDDDDIPF